MSSREPGVRFCKASIMGVKVGEQGERLGCAPVTGPVWGGSHHWGPVRGVLSVTCCS